jgi:Chaperone of endosialidase
MGVVGFISRLVLELTGGFKPGGGPITFQAGVGGKNAEFPLRRPGRFDSFATGSGR